jgi:hypothetical protein
MVWILNDIAEPSNEKWADPELKVANQNEMGRAGEVVRSCMIECRKTSMRSYGVFESSLRACHARLAE